ncbi:MAG TPA: DUF1707 domain-containing protein [Streptosporangiaceae bacterium]|nr:DUF1707 domain-containing protein [Streptosporangiaceae bacterium]
MTQSTLASNVERDAVTQRLQVAFAEHRLTDEEFDQRVRRALTARTLGELDCLTADLPAAAPAMLVATATGHKPGRFAVALKSSISRAGRWTLPRRFFSLVYKGDGLLDLRAAQLTASETVITAVSYKSRTEVLLPPGVRLELGGTGVSAAGEAWPGELPPGAPVVRVRGVAYKGSIEVRTTASA